MQLTSVDGVVIFGDVPARHGDSESEQGCSAGRTVSWIAISDRPGLIGRSSHNGKVVGCMSQDFTEKELADWLDGFARDLSDLGDRDGTSEKLRHAARLLRAQVPEVATPFPYILVAGGKM